MKVLAVVALVLLTGCDVTEGLSRWKGEHLCKGHGGIYKFTNYKDTGLICNTGKRFTWNNVHALILPLEGVGVENNDD